MENGCKDLNWMFLTHDDYMTFIYKCPSTVTENEEIEYITQKNFYKTFVNS